MKNTATALIVCFLLVYVVQLGVRPFAIPDESRYAEIPREMIASGDWVSPKLVGIRYFEKPVLGYWLNAISMSLFGQNRFAARLPVAAAAGLSALLVFIMLRRRSARTGLIAAGVLLSCILFFVIGVFSVLDGPLTLFTTGTMVFFFLAWSEPATGRRVALLAACGVFCGLSFLTKGFLALVIPVIVVVPFLAWEKRWKDYLVMPWIPALAALLVALPWCILVALREPDFWHYFFWVEHVDRFLNPGAAQHPEPFWYFVPILAGGALPWTTLFPAAAVGLGKAGIKDSLIRYCICWVLFPFLFFSASSGKLGTYILPCFPPLAILLAIGLEKYFDSGNRRLFNVAAGLTGACIVLATIALLVIQTTGILGFRIYASDEIGKCLPVAVGLLAWAVLAGISARVQDWRHKIALFCVGPMLFYAGTHSAMSREMEKEKAPESFLTSNARIILPGSILVSDDYVGPAVCWFFKRSDILLVGEGGELKYGLTNYPDAAGRLLSVEKLSELTANSGRDIVLIVDIDRFNKFKDALPPAETTRIDNGFVMLRYRASGKNGQ